MPLHDVTVLLPMNSPGRHSLPARVVRQQVDGAMDLPALQREAMRELSFASLAVALLATLLAWAARLGPHYTIKALLLYAAGAWLVWRALRRSAHPHGRFGAANRVTLGRLALAVLLAALVGEDMPAAWWIVALAALTALLDAVDGALARRSGLASAFGARFDMETDAAFTLVLCALVLQAGQAGPWVLAAGLMRYAFVATASAWPWLAAPLPPSRRRQAVCVLQISTLISCLSPIVPSALASMLAAAGLALLTGSFAIDVRTLGHARHNIVEA